MKTFFRIITLALLFTASSRYIYTQVKIMPMGESVAWGASSTDWGGFRRPLHILLTNIGYDIDFIGGESLGIPDDFDTDNECHRSWFVANSPDTTKYKNFVDWTYTLIKNRPPKILLLYAGSTDLYNGDSASSVIAGVETMLNEIDRFERESKKSILVIVSTLINCNGILTSSPVSKEITKFNRELIQLVQRRINDPVSPDNLKIVDMEKEAGLDYRIDAEPPFTNGDLRDDYYPNDSGYVKMAKVWANAFQNVLDPVNLYLINLQAPGKDSIITSNYCTFKWETHLSQTAFRLEIAKDFYFRNIVFDQKNLTGDSIRIQGLESNQKYYWRLIAENPEQKLTYSTIKTFSIQVQGSDPQAANNLTAEELPLNNVKLSWNDITNDELGFIIERRTGKSNYTVLDTLPANSTIYVDTSLSTHSTYSYRIKSFNKISASVYSNEAIITIISILPAPSNLTTSAVSFNKVMLKWNDMSGNELGFIIERKTADGNFGILDTVHENTTAYIDSNLSAGVKYTYRVKCFKTNNISPYSNESAITLSSYVLVNPRYLSAVLIKSYKVRLSWLSANSNVEGFIIERKTGTEKFIVLDTIPGTVKFYIDSSLGTGNYYIYRVKSFNKYYTSDYSNIRTITITTGVDNADILPAEYSLEQNYPNPFNPVTNISFKLPVASEVQLTIYDIRGNKINDLIAGNMNAGAHVVKFDGSNLSSGIYFYRIQAGTFTDTKKLLLLK